MEVSSSSEDGISTLHPVSYVECNQNPWTEWAVIWGLWNEMIVGRNQNSNKHNPAATSLCFFSFSFPWPGFKGSWNPAIVYQTWRNESQEQLSFWCIFHKKKRMTQKVGRESRVKRWRQGPRRVIPRPWHLIKESQHLWGSIAKLLYSNDSFLPSIFPLYEPKCLQLLPCAWPLLYFGCIW